MELAGSTITEGTVHHEIQIIPMNELEPIQCLFCYTPVQDFKVNRVYKRVLRKTCQRLFRFVCNHLDIEVPDNHPRRKGPDKLSKEARLQPGNLPLCHSCREGYYNDIYEAFVTYENIAVKLASKISDCITRAIAISATNNSQAPRLVVSETSSSFQNYINEHNVMNSVKKFRQKVLEKNPMCYLDKEVQGTCRTGVETCLSSRMAPVTQAEFIDSSKLIDKDEQSQCLSKQVDQSDSCDIVRTKHMEMEIKHAISPLDPTYYAVSNPAPGVIQIIPVVVDNSKSIDFKQATKREITSLTESICDPSKTRLSKKPLRRRRQQFAIIESFDCDNNVQEQKIQIVSRGLKKRNEPLNKCKFCNKTYPSRVALIDHEVKVHGKEKPEKCSKCEYRCLSKSSLRSHMETHLDDKEKSKPFECNQCTAKFRFKRSLDSHLRSHSGEKPYICEVCKKAFSCRESMKLCIDKHNGVKKHECQWCQRRFLRKEVLEIHVRTHTGEKPFICQICKKGFAQRAPLKTHLKMHAKKCPSSATTKAKTK